jgi:phosphoribosylformimino-5-aminoimidazole carboxamide ribotide isomerase
LPGLELLSESVDLLGAQRAVFSLDLKAGQPITAIAALRGRPPLDIANQAIAAGLRRLIVLELTSVGTGFGPATLMLCRELRAAHPSVEIISGGGVRSRNDVEALVSAGCDRVLVASALHDGQLTDRI